MLMKIAKQILLMTVSLCAILSISRVMYISAFQKIEIGFVAVAQTVEILDYKNYNTYADFIEELDFDELMLKYNVEEDSYDYINLAISFDRDVNFYDHNNPEYSIDEFLEEFGDKKIQDGALVHFVYYKEVESEEVEIIKYESSEEKDNTLASGTTKIKKEGVDGKSVTPKTEVYRNGSLIDTIIGVTKTTDPIDEVVLIGTRVVNNYSSNSNSSYKSSSSSSSGNSSSSSDSSSGSNNSNISSKLYYYHFDSYGWSNKGYSSKYDCNVAAGEFSLAKQLEGDASIGSWSCKQL